MNYADKETAEKLIKRLKKSNITELSRISGISRSHLYQVKKEQLPVTKSLAKTLMDSYAKMWHDPAPTIDRLKAELTVAARTFSDLERRVVALQQFMHERGM